MPFLIREEEWLKQEEALNDSSLVWPAKEALENLPTVWIENNQIECSKKDRNGKQSDACKQVQPYYLNHVRGSTRIRQASQRIGAALGTMSSSFLLCRYASFITLEDIGLNWSRDFMLDLCCGTLVGAFIVSCTFIAHLALGWIRVTVSSYNPSSITTDQVTISLTCFGKKFVMLQRDTLRQ